MTKTVQNGWLKQRLKELKPSGKSGAGLAGVLGIQPARITDIIVGRRRIQGEEISPMADYLEMPREALIENINASKKQRTVPPRTGGQHARPAAISVAPAANGATQIMIPAGVVDADELRQLVRLYAMAGRETRDAIRMRLQHPEILARDTSSVISDAQRAHIDRIARELAAGNAETALFIAADIAAIATTNDLPISLTAGQRVSLIDAYLARAATESQRQLARASPLRKRAKQP